MECGPLIHKVYIGVGSNLPAAEALAEIEQSAAALRQFGTVRASASYRTEGVGLKSAGMVYHNAVIEMLTGLSEESLNAVLKRYENMHGRDRGSAVVTIDLDLVVYDGVILRANDFRHTYFLRGYRQLTGENQ